LLGQKAEQAEKPVPSQAQPPSPTGKAETEPEAEPPAPSTNPPEKAEAKPETTPPPEKAETPAPLTKKPKRAKPKKEKPKETEDTEPDLDSCLAEMNRMFSRLFRVKDEERTELLRRCAHVQKENERLEAEASRLRDRVEDIEGQLDRSRRAEAETAERLGKAEARASDHEEAARRAGERAERLERDLGDALEEIKATERRARDDMHQANLRAEHAARGVRYQIREGVLPFLSEATDEAVGLTPEQERLRGRLRQVLDALRDLGVDTD
jgi:chromosome segregation ATPase